MFYPSRPLAWLGMTIFGRFGMYENLFIHFFIVLLIWCKLNYLGVAQILNTDEATLRNWLTLIEGTYN